MAEWIVILGVLFGVILAGVLSLALLIFVWTVISELTFIGKLYDRHRQTIHTTMILLVACHLLGGVLYGFGEHLSGKKIDNWSVYMISVALVGGLSFLLCGGVEIVLRIIEP